MPAVRRDVGEGSGRARRRWFAAAAAVACGLVLAFLALPRLLGPEDAGEPDLVPGATLAPAPRRSPEAARSNPASTAPLAEPATGPCALTGEVYLGPRQPAAGAGVVFEETGVKPRTATADERGVWRIDGLPDGCSGRLRASAAGRADAVAQVQPLDPGERRRVEPMLLAAPVRVVCNVAGPDGEPVAGVTVEAFPNPWTGAAAWSEPDLLWRDEPDPAAREETGELGRAVFAALGEGAWTFVARRQGFTTCAVERLVESGASAAPVTLRIAPAARLAGRVVDGGSNPLRGVIVWAAAPADGHLDPRLAAVADARAVTAEDGSFDLHSVAEGPVRLLVSLRGSPRAEYGTVRVPWSGALTIVLAGPCVEGVVRDAVNGGPVPGAVVTGTTIGRAGARGAVRTVSDAEGRYALESLVPAERLVGVRADAGGLSLAANDPCGTPAGIRLVARATLRRDLVVKPAARVTGRVTAGGVPVAGAGVVGMAAGDAGRAAWTRAATTDADGRYVLADAPAAPVFVYVVAPGLVQSGVTADSFHWPPERRRELPNQARVESPGDVTLDVVMEPAEGAELAGRVVDNEDRAIPGAVVTSWCSRVLCDADGAFRANAGRLVVSAAGYVTAEVEGDPAQAGRGGVLEIALTRGARVRGVVAAAEAVAGAFVQVAAFRDVFPAGASRPDPAAWLGVARHPVDRAGSFDVPMDAASGGFVVRAAGHGLVAARPTIVSSDGTEDPRAVAIRLERGVRLKGTVVRAEDGHPVAGARIAIGDHDSESGPAAAPLVAAVSGSDGAFAVEGLPRGDLALVVSAPGFLPATRRAAAPGDDLVVALAAAQAIEGTVLLHDGSPAADCTVSALQEGVAAPPVETRTDESGGFRIEPLAPGLYSLTTRVAVAGRSLRPTTHTAGVRAGATGVRVEVGEAPSVAGVVLGEDGAPVEGVVVSARSASTGRVSEAPPTRADGRFAIVGLDDGEHRVSAVPPGSRGVNGARFVLGRTLLPAEVRAAQDAHDLVVTLARGLAIEGVARLGDRSPLRGGVVVAEPTSGVGAEPCAAVTGPDGSFTITGLAAGTYRLGRTELDRPGRPVTFAGGEAVEVVAGSSVTLRGRVVDEQGIPIPGARVQARPRPRGRPLAAVARQDGVFALEGAVSGVDYDVEAWTPEHAPFVVQGISAAGATPRIVLRRGLESSGRLLDTEGRPVPGAELTFETEATSVQPTAMTDAEGRFTVRGLVAGVYRASVAARTMQSSRATLVPCGTLEAGATDAELRSPR